MMGDACGACWRNNRGTFRFCTAPKGHDGQHWVFEDGRFVSGWGREETCAPPPTLPSTDEIQAWLAEVRRSGDEVEREAARVLLESVSDRTTHPPQGEKK